MRAGIAGRPRGTSGTFLIEMGEDVKVVMTFGSMSSSAASTRQCVASSQPFPGRGVLVNSTSMSERDCAHGIFLLSGMQP